MNILLWARNVLLVGGLILLLVCGIVTQRTASFLGRSRSVTGQITDLVARQQPGENVNFYPAFQFMDENGKPWTLQSATGSNPAGFTVGQSVQVRYLAGEPQNARIATFWQIWLWSVVLGFIGVVWLIIGVGAAFALRRQQ